jgi:REP element-mobilizing transposase RayT
MDFEFFDPAGELRITVGNLPHWFQPGVTYFVTFRTDDSLPAEVARLWYARRDEWLQRHGVSPRGANRSALVRRLPTAQQREFHNRFSRRFMAYLDRGYGACVLKRREPAGIVADNLTHFDGQRYQLGEFVVMPNHVHLLACLLGKTDLEQQCYAWKKYTATRINRALGQRGRFWHEESFDHLVRSPEEFEHLRRYIVENPQEARLHEGEYLVWRCREPS